MKVEIKELKPKKGVIKIQDTHPYFVNSIRRIMISELPKLAVEDVVIYDNTSALFDEIISHRLGLVPIPTDLGLLTFRDECVCKGKGCPNCTVRYTLSKEGEGTVYSGDLQSAEKSWSIGEDKIPIVKLAGEQRLILEVEAVLGRPKDHSKWQSVISPSYRMDVKIEFDKENLHKVKDFLSKIPRDLVSIKSNELELKDPAKRAVLESYIDKFKVDFIKITKDPNNYTFSFETDGSLKSKDALLESAKILQSKYSELNKKLKEIKL